MLDHRKVAECHDTDRRVGQAARVYRAKHCLEWRTVYLSKKAQGKTAKQALIVVAVKLLHTVYAMLKHRRPYNPSLPLLAAASSGA